MKKAVSNIWPKKAKSPFLYTAHYNSGVETGGAGGHHPPHFFCNAVSNENNMKNIEIANGLIFKKHIAFLTSRLPMILCP